MSSFSPDGRATFGARFGLLVRSFREDLGLSAKALAIKIWDDECRKSSISKLENGRVARPTAKTVHAIAYALDIPQQEIDALRGVASPFVAQAPDLSLLSAAHHSSLKALTSELGLSEASTDYGCQLNGASDPKSEKRKSYCRQIEYLDDSIRKLDALRQKANTTGSITDFERVEEYLAEIDGIQMRLLLDARHRRAINALHRGKIRQSYALLLSAAVTAGALDLPTEAMLRSRYHKIFFEYGVSHEAIGFLLAARLLRPSIAIFLKLRDYDSWAWNLQNLANALASLAVRTNGKRSELFFDEATRSYLAAQGHFTRADYPVEWGLMQQNLGSALFARAAKTNDNDSAKLELLVRAGEAFESALEVRSKQADPREWAMTRQNYAAVLQARGALTPGSWGAQLLREALAVFEETLSIRTFEKLPLEWAMTRENMALAEADLAERPATAARLQHVAAALVHVEAALKVYDGGGVPYFRKKAASLRDTLQVCLETGGCSAT